MDLRRRLVGLLGLLLGGLLAMTALIQIVSLKADIEAEVGAQSPCAQYQEYDGVDLREQCTHAKDTHVYAQCQPADSASHLVKHLVLHLAVDRESLEDRRRSFASHHLTIRADDTKVLQILLVLLIISSLVAGVAKLPKEEDPGEDGYDDGTSIADTVPVPYKYCTH